MIEQDYQSLIGQKVFKRHSGKPFKSGLKVNTAKTATLLHPVTGKLCFTFEEDESYVEASKCAIYEGEKHA